MLIVTALALTGFELRLGVTSVGFVLDDIQRGLHIDSTALGLLTKLPVPVLRGSKSVRTWLEYKVGLHRTLVLALAVSFLGYASRAFAPDIRVFLVLSVVTLPGANVANVLLYSLVKLHFPERIGPMTGVYATALSIGTAIAAGGTAPIADAGGSWRLGLAVWAAFPALAILPWLSKIRRESRPAERCPASPANSVAGISSAARPHGR